ncbi:hypothetical protein MMC18_003043 [Xylographa bjoerkii]|nr:hypothetical protein [Xylographa bjoerkii]
MDDVFFFLAVAALVTGSSFYFIAIPYFYLFSNVADGIVLPPTNVLERGAQTSTYATVAAILLSFTIYSVKFSFIFYFRKLLVRQPKMTKWWWCVLTVLIPVAIVAVLESTIVCPSMGVALEMCLLRLDFLRREHVAVYGSVAIDILTDMLLISIPVCVLRQTALKRREKLSIGLVSCLSVVIIVIAILRAGFVYILGSDQVWTAFLVNSQASISVIMVCMTAFRTLFVTARASQQSNVQGRAKPSASRWSWWKKVEPELDSIDIRMEEFRARTTGAAGVQTPGSQRTGTSRTPNTSNENFGTQYTGPANAAVKTSSITFSGPVNKHAPEGFDFIHEEDPIPVPVSMWDSKGSQVSMESFV